MIKIYGVRLVFRIAVFLVAIEVYLKDKSSLMVSNGLSLNGIKPLHILWMILAVEMILKFFPQKAMSMGCRKQFKSNYLPSEERLTQADIDASISAENATAQKVFAVWFGGNAIIAVLHFAGILGESGMLLLSLFYYVCDIMCILLYCPFQSLIMKNRCCITCRIFNWDSIMMVTPLIFIPSVFSWSLVAIALCLLFHWEITYRKFPQRFLEESNENLRCNHCHEKICRFKQPIYMQRH